MPSLLANNNTLPVSHSFTRTPAAKGNLVQQAAYPVTQCNQEQITITNEYVAGCPIPSPCFAESWGSVVICAPRLRSILHLRAARSSKASRKKGERVLDLGTGAFLQCAAARTDRQTDGLLVDRQQFGIDLDATSSGQAHGHVPDDADIIQHRVMQLQIEATGEVCKREEQLQVCETNAVSQLHTLI